MAVCIRRTLGAPDQCCEGSGKSDIVEFDLDPAIAVPLIDFKAAKNVDNLPLAS